MHQPKASSGSSSVNTTLGAVGGKTLYATKSKVAVLILPQDSVAVLPTATGIAPGPECFNGDCGPTNATHHSITFTHPTPVPKLQLRAQEAQDGQLASLPNRRRNRHRALQTSGNDEAAPITELNPTTTGTVLAKTGGTYWPTYR